MFKFGKRREKCHGPSGRGEPANYLGRRDVTGGFPNQKGGPEALLRKNFVNQGLKMRFQSTGNLKNYF